jgi:hypothetical protein
MSGSRLLGFLNVAPMQTETTSTQGWGRPAQATPTNPPQPILQAAVDANAREWFKTLAEEWHRDTSGQSSMTMRKRHRAYHGIVKLGQPAVPLLLEALRSMPDFWFPALREITKENPVDPEDRGDYAKMATAWLEWGRQRGLIS